MLPEKGLDLTFVLFRLQGAGRIDQQTSGLDNLGAGGEQLRLTLGQRPQCVGSDAPPGIWMPRERAGSEAGRIEQDRIRF